MPGSRCRPRWHFRCGDAVEACLDPTDVSNRKFSSIEWKSLKVLLLYENESLFLHIQRLLMWTAAKILDSLDVFSGLFCVLTLGGGRHSWPAMTSGRVIELVKNGWGCHDKCAVILDFGVLLLLLLLLLFRRFGMCDNKFFSFCAKPFADLLVFFSNQYYLCSVISTSTAFCPDACNPWKGISN